MHLKLVRTATTMVAVLSAATILAQTMPRGSFLVTPVQSRWQLIQQIETNPEVSMRYQRHFGMTHEEVVQYFSTLNTSTVDETGTYTVWYTRPGYVTYESKSLMLRRGEPAFVDRSGTVVLRLKCGNPMVDRTVAREYFTREVVAVQQPVTEEVVTTTTTVRPQRFVVSRVEPLVVQHNLTWSDAAAAVVLANSMGVAPEEVVVMRTPELSTTTFMDLAPAILMAWNAKRPLTDVWNMYTGGRTWLDLATDLALPNTYWNTNWMPTTAWTNTDFTTNMWQSLLFNNLFVPSSEFTFFNDNSIPLEQWLVASVIGREFNIPAREALAAYQLANNWSTVESNFMRNPPISTRVRIGG